MTALARVVRRSVQTPHAQYVVILTPGPIPLIEIREKGRRRGYAIPVGALYTVLALRAADSAHARYVIMRRIP